MVNGARKFLKSFTKNLGRRICILLKQFTYNEPYIEYTVNMEFSKIFILIIYKYAKSFGLFTYYRLFKLVLLIT